MSVSVDSYVACLSDWRSVLRLVALMTGSPEFPDMGDPDFCLRILISRVDFSDVGRHCAMDFSARKDFPARALRVLRVCVEESTGAEDWGYIRPVADGEAPQQPRTHFRARL